MESLLLLLAPLVVRLLEVASVKDAERFREIVGESVERRKAAVARSEALDAPRDPIQ